MDFSVISIIFEHYMKKLYLILIGFIHSIDCFIFNHNINLDSGKQKNLHSILFPKIQFHKLYILLILMVCNYSNLFSQYTYKLPSDWRQAVYYHENIFNSPPDSPLPIEYIGDTVLCGKTYNKIIELSFFWIANQKAKYIRIDNGRYFELRDLNSCKEVLLYDFTLNELDTFYPFKLNRNYVNTWIYSDYYIVDSISNVTLSDSLIRKWMRLKSNDGLYRDYMYWVEGIGDIEMGFFLNGDFEGGKTSLICHKEEQKTVWETTLNNHFENCDDLIDLLDSNKKTCLTGNSKISNKNRNNNWHFGHNAAVDFNGDFPKAITNSAMLTESGCASISDGSGELLFYTDGKTVWNKNHDVMLNGDNLTGQSSYEQSVLIVPEPGNESVYYLFITYENGSLNNFCYSKVNMRLDRGLGAVEYSNKNKLILPNVANKLTATFHANCKDVWIIVHGLGNATFYSYKLSHSGLVFPPILSNIGVVNNKSSYDMQLKISPNGKKLANCISNRWMLQLFDFDNQTGNISNSISITYRARFAPMSCEFSPNSNKLYIFCLTNSLNLLMQYDISQYDSLAINQSEVVISFNSSGFLQLATNGKIYVANPYNYSYLGVINNPDEKAINSNFVENEIYLEGKRTYRSLPNFLYPNQCADKPDFIVDVRCINENTYFYLIGSACIDSLKWGFGNGTYSKVQSKDSMYYTYEKSGSFLTQMIYWKNGRADTIEKSIVIPESYIDTQTINICEGDTLYVDDKFYTSAGKYLDTFQSIYGCDSILLTKLTINKIDSVFQFIEICPGDTFFQNENKYYETGNYSDIYSSIWGCDSIVVTNIAVKVPVVTTNTFNECEGFVITEGANTYTVSGVYKDITNNCDTIITDLTINPNPDFSFIKTDDNCQERKGAVAIINITGTPPFSYEWNIGSNDSVITGLEKGSYVVSLTDSNGCMISDTAELFDFEIGCEPYLYIPNAFSPNGDGVNDVFKVSTHNVSYFKMQIFNRWGELIFKSNDPDIGWDGRYNGDLCQSGVYTLIIEYSALNSSHSQNLQHSGTLNLIR